MAQPIVKRVLLALQEIAGLEGLCLGKAAPRERVAIVPSYGPNARAMRLATSRFSVVYHMPASTLQRLCRSQKAIYRNCIFSNYSSSRAEQNRADAANSP